MPTRVLVVGLLFAASGLLAVWDVVVQAMRSTVSLNFGVFLLPVGIGLLRGRPSSRRWAIRWIVFGYVLCGIIAVLGLADSEQLHATWMTVRLEGPDAVPYFLVSLGFLSASLILAHLALASAVSRSWFEI